jgi:hypothetical protein
MYLTLVKININGDVTWILGLAEVRGVILDANGLLLIGFFFSRWNHN